MNNRVLSLISLATKAGKVTSGELAVENAVKDGKAHLVIVACDASDRTKNKVNNMCAFYKVHVEEYGDKESLGHYTGNEYRVNVAIIDEGFSKTIMQAINGIQ